jgi:hypothetical protein
MILASKKVPPKTSKQGAKNGILHIDKLDSNSLASLSQTVNRELACKGPKCIVCVLKTVAGS